MTPTPSPWTRLRARVDPWTRRTLGLYAAYTISREEYVATEAGEIDADTLGAVVEYHDGLAERLDPEGER